MKNLTAHLYYEFQEMFLDEKFATSNNVAANHTDWTLGNKDTVHTVGASIDWRINDKAKLKLADNLSYGATAFTEGYMLVNSATTVQPPLPANIVSPLPDQKTLTNSVSLTGEYKLRENVILLASYAFERGSLNDYLYGQAAGSASNGANVLSLGGDGNPSYSVHVLGAAVRVKW